MEKIDLHIHSNLSDGDLSIDELIKLACTSNCRKIAITDHERIEDYSKFNTNDINIINGIEFNSSVNRLHILGYGIKDIDRVKRILDIINRENEEICCELIEILNKNGYDITYKNVVEYIETIGLNCDIIDKRKIVKYLIYKGYYDNVLNVYNDLIGKGTKFYIPIRKLEPYEIIDLINYNGGVSVLAHPSTLNLNKKDLLKKIKELIEYGLDGIEIINNKMDNEYELYKEITNKYNLICTVGTDFHSLKQGNLGVDVNKDLFSELNDKIKSKRLRK